MVVLEAVDTRITFLDVLVSMVGSVAVSHFEAF